MAERLTEFGELLGCRQASERRQQIGGERDAEHALGQFHQPHRIVEGGYDGRVEPKRKAVGGEHVDLEGGNANRAGQHLAHDFADGGVPPGGNPLVAVALAREGRQLKECLGHTGHQHADGQGEDLLLQSPAHVRGEQKHAGDHDHVQQHRPQRRHEEVAAGVSHADEHGG